MERECNLEERCSCLKRPISWTGRGASGGPRRAVAALQPADRAVTAQVRRSGLRASLPVEALLTNFICRNTGCAACRLSDPILATTSDVDVEEAARERAVHHLPVASRRERSCLAPVARSKVALANLDRDTAERRRHPSACRGGGLSKAPPRTAVIVRLSAGTDDYRTICSARTLRCCGS